MNTSFERTSGSDEWYTPLEIVRALGHFDLDPASPPPPIIHKTADIQYNKFDNGLSKEWFGRVWLNPPYSHPLIDKFVEKMAKHGSGIMLTFDRMDNRMMQEKVIPFCDSVFFMKGRIKFVLPDGTQKGGAGCGSILVSYSEYDTEMIKRSNIKGFLVKVV